MRRHCRPGGGNGPGVAACGFTPCIPQLGTTKRLDGLLDTLSSHLAYRRFPDDHQPLVTNHSIASSATIKPSIAHAGHVAADPAGQVGLGQATVVAGAGAQTGTLRRWGDLSMMSLDPVDECTCWHTAEYLPTDGTFNWRTRIASFTLPGRAPPDFGVAATLTVQQGAPGTIALSAAVTAGAPATLDLVAAASPPGAGVTASIIPAMVVAGGGATLAVDSSGMAAPGLFIVTVTGTGIGKSHATTVSVTVTAAPVTGPPPNQGGGGSSSGGGRPGLHLG